MRHTSCSSSLPPRETPATSSIPRLPRRMASMSDRRLISSGSTFEADIAYSRAVVQGDWVFVSGTTGFDYERMTIASDLATQTEQCLKNIASALQEADASL